MILLFFLEKHLQSKEEFISYCFSSSCVNFFKNKISTKNFFLN